MGDKPPILDYETPQPRPRKPLPTGVRLLMAVTIVGLVYFAILCIARPFNPPDMPGLMSQSDLWLQIMDWCLALLSLACAVMLWWLMHFTLG